jgi:hypothetical protein
MFRPEMAIIGCSISSSHKEAAVLLLMVQAYLSSTVRVCMGARLQLWRCVCMGARLQLWSCVYTPFADAIILLLFTLLESGPEP